MEPDRENEILSRLERVYPVTVTALEFKDPQQLLVATILSAQCTDKRVNVITKDLFKKYKTTRDFASADPDKLEQEVRSAGFYRNKTKNIIGSARMILSDFGGEVPMTMGEMLLLPGVQRKTANVVLSEAFGVIEGIAVDTHVKRLSNRLGLSKESDPVKIEKDLMNIYPRDLWYAVCNLLIYHGRSICKARRPLCEECALDDICPSVVASKT